VIHLSVDGPFDWPAMLAYFRPRAIRGVEAVDADAYRRVTRVGEELVVVGGERRLSASLGPRSSVARLCGLDGDHAAALHALRRDPVVGRRVRSRPGLRVPGTWDPYETGVRAIVGQQVSVAGASTVTARIVARHGRPADGVGSGLERSFPGPEVLADADLDGLGLTGGRITAIRGWAAAVASGDVRLDGDLALEDLVDAIVSIRGLGPWTAHYVAVRAGYADAFPVADLGLQRSAGLDAKALAAVAERWRPFRALAAVHLWETPA
jgi:AraC family transcriptional regulator of adaptative response / DNA-3-methyladenine glycosylase II